MFLVRMDMLNDMQQGMQYKPRLQNNVSTMINLQQLKQPLSEHSKPYFCSQNYLLSWSRCTLLRYTKDNKEHTELAAYLRQFNQSSEQIMKSTKKEQHKKDIKSRGEEYHKLSLLRDESKGAGTGTMSKSS